MIAEFTPSVGLKVGDRVLAPYRPSRWERFKMRLRHPFTRPPETVQAVYVVTATYP